VVALSANEGALLGGGGSNIGAPAGWHMVTMDRFGNIWDNLKGFQGYADDFLQGIVEANPSGVNISISRLVDDAYRWLIAGGH
jgi:hypothetical protein